MIKWMRASNCILYRYNKDGDDWLMQIRLCGTLFFDMLPVLIVLFSAVCFPGVRVFAVVTNCISYKFLLAHVWWQSCGYGLQLIMVRVHCYNASHKSIKEPVRNQGKIVEKSLRHSPFGSSTICYTLHEYHLYITSEICKCSDIVLFCIRNANSIQICQLRRFLKR